MGKLRIYDRRKEAVDGWVVSMVRCNENMHDGPSPSTGEVIVYRYQDGPGSVDPSWTGHAAIAGDVFRFFVDHLQRGFSVEEIEEACVNA